MRLYPEICWGGPYNNNYLKISRKGTTINSPKASKRYPRGTILYTNLILPYSVPTYVGEYLSGYHSFLVATPRPPVRVNHLQGWETGQTIFLLFPPLILFLGLY